MQRRVINQMSWKKFASIVFVILVLLPFFVDVFAPIRAVRQPFDEFGLKEALLNPGFWAHALPVATICVILIVRAKSFSTSQKLLWIVFIAVLWPIAAVSLMYRLYWYQPIRIPQTVEEQRRIIRAMADDIRSTRNIE